MPFQAPHVEYAAIAPEIALSVFALVLLVLHTFVEDKISTLYLPIFATVGLLVSAYFAVDAWGLNELQLNGMVAADSFASFVKVALVVFGISGVWLGREYFARENVEQSEYYGLLMFAVAGMMLMASAANLIVIF